jgi:hypothetical protein
MDTERTARQYSTGGSTGCMTGGSTGGHTCGNRCGSAGGNTGGKLTAEGGQVGVVGGRRHGHGAGGAAVQVAEAVGQQLQAVRREPVLVHQYVVVHRRAGALPFQKCHTEVSDRQRWCYKSITQAGSPEKTCSPACGGARVSWCPAVTKVSHRGIR